MMTLIQTHPALRGRKTIEFPYQTHEQWRQYGQEQTSQHSGEIAKLSSYDANVEEMGTDLFSADLLG
ncbi:hypothetical protein [Pseudomonas mandelii]|uniref:hypothetical protein n=1 Tax=Pseudomonas mandelii TaxID=75612 RepID=UPI00039ECA4E